MCWGWASPSSYPFPFAAVHVDRGIDEEPGVGFNVISLSAACALPIRVSIRVIASMSLAPRPCLVRVTTVSFLWLVTESALPSDEGALCMAGGAVLERPPPGMEHGGGGIELIAPQLATGHLMGRGK